MTDTANPNPSMLIARDVRRDAIDLFFVSLVALYAELLVIRWLASEIRVFAYFKNLPLLASFLGLGLGLLYPAARRLERAFGWLFSLPCLLCAFAGPLRLVHLPFPDRSVALWGAERSLPLLQSAVSVGVMLAIFFVVVAAFAALGVRLSRLFTPFAPLAGYSINLLGSLAGIALFSLLSRSELGPAAWVAVLVGCLVAFDRDWRVWAPLAVTVVVGLWAPQAGAWSPYYRIDYAPYVIEAGGDRVEVGIELSVNHDYHQHAFDLSDRFMDEHPALATHPIYAPARRAYALPYLIKPRARRVLVVGAGTGNDVAAALRAGAESVDAVEIDPTIVSLGIRYHPERPYDSPKVHVAVDDARAFFRQAQGPYDLIVFGLLDSHTMFSSLSSLRLDNYVYTLESLRQALSLLAPDGVMAVSFSKTSGGWISQRLYNTLTVAAGKSPRAIFNGYNAGVTFFTGRGVDGEAAEVLRGFRNWKWTAEGPADVPIATDAWPFLYIRPNAWPTVYFVVLGLILSFAWLLVRRALASAPAGVVFDWHFFLLGAGFMLVEVKSVAELSLLFGSTWLVNSAVFGGILVMALAANWLVLRFDIRRAAGFYAGLFAALVLSFLIRLDILNVLPFAERAAVGAFLASLPIFFGGIVFAARFRSVAFPAAALGANLLGAMAGGVLEYSSMFFGIPALNLVALALYGGSLAALLLGWHGPRRAPAAP